AFDPEIHRVAGNKLRALDLRQDVELQSRVDVTEKDKWSAPELLGNLRSKIREDAEMGLERLSDIEIMPVPAAPPEGATFRVFEAGEIDTALGEGLQLLNRVIVPDHADELHLREMACRRREERRRPPEDVVGLTKRRLHGVESDGAHYK